MNRLLDYFPELTPIQISKFNRLELIYKNWNQKINVISRKDIDNFFIHHLLHSLAIVKAVSFNAGDTILDVGTGGGFPGIPLSIFYPESSFTLVDSIGKKITVVNEIIKELEIKNVTAKKTRAEEVKTKYNFIVSRAVTSMPNFIELIKNNLIAGEKNGLYCLKGGDLVKELIDFPEAKLISISDFFEDNFFETKKIVFLSSNHIINL